MESFATFMVEHHNLVRHPKLSARNLRDEIIFWIPREIHRSLYDQIVGYLRTLDFDPRQFREAHAITQALDFAAAGAGIALVPYSAQRFNRSGVVFRPLTDELMRIETALFVRRKQMLETAKDFIGIVFAATRALKLSP